MVRGLLAVLLLVFALLGSVQPAQAAPPTRAQVDAACTPGKDPQVPGNNAYPGGLSEVASGLTPQTLPGATTISVAEAKCMMERFGEQVIVLAAMEGERGIPGAYPVVDAAYTDPAIQPQFAAFLAEISGSDKQRPIIVYCHHEQCFLSYNVALRTVLAGYTQVYWMRPGFQGWADAGLAISTPPPAQQTLSLNYVAARDQCRKDDLDYTAQKWADMLTQIPTEQEQEKQFAEDVAEAQMYFRLCFENAGNYDAINSADKADAQQALAGADGEIARMYAAARAEVEANPAKYLAMTWDSHRPSALRQDLATMQKVKTLAQACGSFDFSQPYISDSNQNYVRQLDNRRLEYGKCLEAYRNDDSAIGHTFGLYSANKWVKATRRFTCRASNNKPNCIPNSPFDDIAAIATDANASFVDRQEKLYFEESGKTNDLINALNDWLDTLNQNIDAYNAGY